jgi:hypothetical protein
MATFFEELTFVAILGNIVAIGKFAYEIARDGTKRRGEIYDKLRDRFDGPEFHEVYTALEKYTFALPNEKARAESLVLALPLNLRARFAAFVEHIALVTNSGILNYRLAAYEFGYYAIMCWDCFPFWVDLYGGESHQQDPDWALFGHFVENLKKAKENFKGSPSLEVSKLKF